MHLSRHILIGIVVSASVAPLLAMGCGSSSGTTANTTSLAAGGASSTSIGHGGTTSSSTMGTGAVPSSDGGCSTYPGQDPSSLPGSGCCTFGPSHCAPSSTIPPGLDNGLATCAGGYCAPDGLIQAGSEYMPTPCTANIVGMNLQGACLSECFTLVSGNPMVGLLPKSTCGQGELCVPCIDPLNDVPTGACSLSDVLCGVDAGGGDGGDGGSVCPYTGPPVVNPTTFPDCAPACMGAHCVPAALVPAADTSLLATCMDNGMPGYCAPDTFIESGGNGLPATCTSVAGAEGRCLSTCLPPVAAQADLLPQDVCATDEKCVPCFNPTAADPTAPTGACTLACDKPANPPTMITCPWTGPPVIDPTTLPACDNGGCAGAHCLPSAEVPAALQSQLAACSNNTGFCAPDTSIAADNQTLAPTCDPFPGSGAPGRCLSMCLPAVAARAKSGSIVQSSCGADQYCVPCNDPFTAASTGACTLGCDTPPAKPFTFPQCCNDGSGTLTGTCIPKAQVPTAQQSELSQSGNGNSAGCPNSAASYLCVPNEYLPAPYNAPPLQYCASTLGACGTCVSQCIVNGALGLMPASDCAANHKCVDCGLASTTPGCSQFCAAGSSCGQACACDGDCANTCTTCKGGSGTCGGLKLGTCD